MKCPNEAKNKEFCTCSYPGCSRKALCCECLRYHLGSGQLPGCVFPPEAEKTYDRSIEYFVSLHKKK